MTSKWAIAEPTNRQPWITYWLWLAGPTAIVLLSCVMSTGASRQVVMPGLGVLPEICTLHTRLGIDCPGCGLTRCFINLAHGEFKTAWSLNPVGLPLFAFVLLQIPLALAAWAGPTTSRSALRILQRLTPWNQLLLIILLLALIVQWCLRLVTGGLT